LRNRCQQIPCDEIFDLPSELADAFNVLSPAGMIPAAMLGLDIMKLLEGAVVMNEHFEKTPPKSNVVFQFVAVNHLLNVQAKRRTRVFHCWDPSLRSVGSWYVALITSEFAGFPSAPSAIIRTRADDTTTVAAQHIVSPDDKLFLNVTVERCRTDPLARIVDGVPLAELLNNCIETTNNALHHASRPTMTITLPTIDTYALGQLFQMLMIATRMEQSLLSG